MRYSDKPIDRPSLDLLGRAGFALSLAQSIDSLAVARDGFVIAVQGEWGAGKTSLIEMICRYLRHIEMERLSRSPLGLENSAIPKTLVELDEMAEVYERVEPTITALDAHYRYSGAVRTARDARWLTIRGALNSDEEADIADRYWRLLERAEADGRNIILRFSPWLISGRAELASALISDLARAIGEKLGDDVKRAFGELLRRLSELAPLVGTGLDMAFRGIGLHGVGLGSLARAGSGWSMKIAEQMASGPTLDDIRNKLESVLANLVERKIVVIVDDLDRLTPYDALEMVSAVKSLGNLPNVVYILSYDEDNLSKLISTASSVDGREFLEKIVQYPIRLPLIDAEDLSKIIDADLNEILPPASADEQKSIQMAWYYVVRHYIKTPRDVRRLVNSFAVAVAALNQYVDLSDLFVLEALRLFDPAVYAYIRRNISDLAE